MLSVRGLIAEHRGNRALHGVDLELGSGEVVAVLGPSGSGKTTLLRAIAGLHRPVSGAMVLEGRDITGVAPEHRGMGFVPQDRALFDHLSVAANVGYGLRRRGSSRTARRERVDEMLSLVGLDGYGARMPDELSGGQQQRVAVARALAIAPRIVLLDEPFSALDAGMRVGLRQEIIGLLRDRGVGVLIVTHDQEEALSLSDRVVLLHEGVVVQQGAPAELFECPADAWAAGFLGDAALLPAVAMGTHAECELGRVPLRRSEHGECLIVVRPGQIEISDHYEAEGPSIGVVVSSRYQGDAHLIELRLASGRSVRCRLPPFSTGLRARARLHVGVNSPVWTVPEQRSPTG